MFMILSAIEDENTRNKVEQIYHLYRKLLYFTAYDILKDYYEAEDAVQNAIIKICDYADKIEEIRCNRTKGFLVIIVRNIAINLYNRRKRKKDIDYEQIENYYDDSSDINPEEHVIRVDDAEWIARKLALINPGYADMLVLRYTYQFSLEEIAQLMDITENHARVKLHRARKALHEVMKGDYHDRKAE